MLSKPLFLFSNPHSHHSFFSYLALTNIGKTILLCPPLQIQLFLKKWTYDLPVFSNDLFTFIVQLLCILSYALYKAHLLAESRYISILTCFTNTLISRHVNIIFFHYQDYVRINPQCRKLLCLDVCEIIINSNPDACNWSSSLQSASDADVIFYPSSSLSGLIDISLSKSYLVPYGGDKSMYLSNIRASPKCKKDILPLSPGINIVARANSMRKGIDILIESLLLLDSSKDPSPLPGFINVFICGKVAEPRSQLLLNHAQEKLSRNQKICISSKQYTQVDYLQLVQSSDLFLMPSRLEGSSPAALESLWLGTPSILSQACGIDQFKNGEHGALMSDLSSQALFDLLYSILLNPIKLRTWRDKLKNDRSLYTWSIYFDSFRSALIQHSDCISV